MLQNVWNQPHPSVEPRRPGAGTRLEAESASSNPWLRWRPKRPERVHVLTAAELSECTCPEICHRDHGND